MMGLKSREKGKAGEREAAEYLRKLGFASARRTQQFNGDGKSDVVCDELPRVHIECKCGISHGFDIGTQKWADACDQAYHDSGERPDWCVLWRKKGERNWKLSFWSHGLGLIVTVAGDVAINVALRRLACEVPPPRMTP
jgi:Holliday junction resolvase